MIAVMKIAVHTVPKATPVIGAVNAPVAMDAAVKMMPNATVAITSIFVVLDFG